MIKKKPVLLNEDIVLERLLDRKRWPKQYMDGQPSVEAILEDGIRLLAKLPALGAGIYRMRFNKGERISPDFNKDTLFPHNCFSKGNNVIF